MEAAKRTEARSILRVAFNKEKWFVDGILNGFVVSNNTTNPRFADPRDQQGRNTLADFSGSCNGMHKPFIRSYFLHRQADACLLACPNLPDCNLFQAADFTG